MTLTPGLAKLQQAWLASEYAQLSPLEIELSFEEMFEGRLVRGRIDAIFAAADGAVRIVDWKTGRVKEGDELAAASLQLRIYRQAYARISGLNPEQIRCGFHYVGENLTVMVDLPSSDI
jgi:DNA helicase-2/ATP-dependent DNA helicase PcrA